MLLDIETEIALGDTGAESKERFGREVGRGVRLKDFVDREGDAGDCIFFVSD